MCDWMRLRMRHSSILDILLRVGDRPVITKNVFVKSRFFKKWSDLGLLKLGRKDTFGY